MKRSTSRITPLQILEDLEKHPAYSHICNDDFFAKELLIHSPLLLPDMEKAVELLEKAITHATGPSGAEREIWIAGDRDVDGVSSTVLLTDYLRSTGLDRSRIRFINSSEGDDYGLTGSFLQRLCDADASLVILLDMGSAHLEEAVQIMKAGKDVIILDHHIPNIPEGIEEELARIAFVNPRLYAEASQLEHQGKIATVGLAFKLILAREMRQAGLWKQCLILEAGEGVFVYRTGAYLGRYADRESAVRAVEELGLKPIPSDIAGLSRMCSLFAAHPESRWRRLLLSSPVGFGRYLFACTLLRRRELLIRTLRECDLVSVGLVADLVPLVGENRRMVALGLGPDRSAFIKELKLSVSDVVRPGLLALMHESGLDPLDLNTRDLNFTINPLINAAGRLGQTEKALDLLLCTDAGQARLLASDLRKLNNLRKERTERNHRIVASHFTFDENRPVVFFYHPELEPGISGVMATRLLEATGRPVVWVNPDGPHARGSARSRQGWNMLELLLPLSDYLVQIGGHAEACGFTIAYDRIEEFEQALYRRALAFEIETRDRPLIIEESPSVTLHPRRLNRALLEELSMLEPFGPGHPEPVIQLRAVRIVSPSTMKKGVHLRFGVSGALATLEFVYWNCPEALRDEVFSAVDGDRENPVLWNLTGSFEKNRIPRMKPLRFRLQAIERASDSIKAEATDGESGAEAGGQGGDRKAVRDVDAKVDVGAELFLSGL